VAKEIAFCLKVLPHPWSWTGNKFRKVESKREKERERKLTIGCP